MPYASKKTPGPSVARAPLDGFDSGLRPNNATSPELETCRPAKAARAAKAPILVTQSVFIVVRERGEERNESMNIDDISVAIQLTANGSSKLKARADVVLRVEGFIELLGFAVIELDGGSLLVKPPSRQGKVPDQYFPTVALRGKINTLIEAEILAEYRRVRNA